MAFDLKEEKDVKEYLEKLGIEYRFGCYHENKPEVCHLLGDFLEAVKKDFEKAGKVFKLNCDDNSFGKSCYKYGNYSLLGRGQERGSGTQAYQYFTKGCDVNDPDACYHKGLMLVTNNPIEKVELNVRKGVETLQKACDGNNSHACHYLSGMYIVGVPKKENKETSKDSKIEYDCPKDMIKAFSLAKKACELHNMYACANVSQMYRKGDGVEKNEKLAEKYKILTLEMQDELKNQKQTLQFQQGL